MIEIGNTDLIELKKYRYKNVRIFAKLEMQNPGGSIKDRIGLWLIHNTQKVGLLNNDSVIIEATSGNTGIGLAIAAQSYGYACRLYVPNTTSKEKIAIMRAYGAVIEIIDGDIDTCISLVEDMSIKSNRCIWLNQFDNQMSIDCHYNTTSKEIEDQIKIFSFDYHNNILVSAMGTTGTIMGCSKRLKPLGWKIFGVMPIPKCKIEGLKNLNIQRKPKIYNLDAIDFTIQVTDKEAIRTIHELCKIEGIMAGPSSGAALYAAICISRDIKQDIPTNIVVILPDSGRNYLNSGVWNI